MDRMSEVSSRVLAAMIASTPPEADFIHPDIAAQTAVKYARALTQELDGDSAEVASGQRALRIETAEFVHAAGDPSYWDMSGVGIKRNYHRILTADDVAYLDRCGLGDTEAFALVDILDGNPNYSKKAASIVGKLRGAGIIG